MAKRAKGEGSLYKTIQKQKRKTFDPRGECAICRECTDRTACNNRQGYEKCEKCKNCKTECLIYCDRFYCNEYTIAQVTVGGKQTTVATGKRQKDVTKKKTDNLSKIDNGKYVPKNNITLSEQLRSTMQYNLDTEHISESTYVRNIDTVKSIENKCPEIANKRIQDITHDDILKILKKHKSNSQSTIEKTYLILSTSLRRAIKDKLLEEDKDPIGDIEADTILSDKDVKKAIPFTIEETKQILAYVDKYEHMLIGNYKSAIDAVSLKNFIKLSFAFGTRCGELGAIDYTKHINFKKKMIIIKRTLTRNTKNQIVMGEYTKTGKKSKRSKKDDTRNVPFGVLYQENEVEQILIEQMNHAKSIKGNKHNLLFCNKDGSYVDVKHISTMFKRICRQAGIKLDLITGCHIHMTKHTVVTRLIELGMDIYAISRLVGTSRRVLESTYAHILDDFIEREIERTLERKSEQQFSIVAKKDDDFDEKTASNVIYLPFAQNN